MGVLPWGAMPLVRRLTAFRLHLQHTHRDDVQRLLALTRQSTKAGYIGRLKLLRQYYVRNRLHEIGCPTVFLAAERDHLVPSVSQARYMAARIPASAVRVLDGHGHICLMAPSIDLSSVIDGWRR